MPTFWFLSGDEKHQSTISQIFFEVSLYFIFQHRNQYMLKKISSFFSNCNHLLIPLQICFIICFFMESFIYLWILLQVFLRQTHSPAFQYPVFKPFLVRTVILINTCELKIVFIFHECLKILRLLPTTINDLHSYSPVIYLRSWGSSQSCHSEKA